MKGSIESTNNGCPICRGAIPDDVYENAKMKDTAAIEMDNVDYRWLYCGRNNGWWAYTDTHNRIIEAAFQDFLENNVDNSVSIVIYGKSYAVNFTAMTQTSPHGDTRGIKRLATDEDLENFDETSLKGIAGIQIKR
uniref:WWE domain protein n=1 Tax=Marseillevirus LCMAC101 TaxID=2506602 RepID=A0A481YQS8_9VIRU|nr:MAG: WWE domain protein [Marseillevirus LCMAC101]